MNYRCETELAAIQEYLQNADVVAFDFETAPLLQYRDDPRAALDAHRACIVGISLSVAEGNALYIPLEHFDGGNANRAEIIPFLRDALWMNPHVIKVVHNLAFESMFLYALGIIVQPPCYDTIAAAQLTLKDSFEFRGLSDSGLKKLVPELLGDELPTFEDVTGGRFFDELNSHDPETVRYACADSDYALRLYLRHWFGEADGVQRIAPDARGNRIWVMEIALPDGWWHMQVVRLPNGLMSYDIPETREQEARWFPQFCPATNV